MTYKQKEFLAHLPLAFVFAIIIVWGFGGFR
jgi:hypothetical protein